MQELAPGVFRLNLLPMYAINAYLIGNLLVDAGIRQVAPLLLAQLRRHRLVAHVLTHAHPDHQGSSAAICRQLGIPLWCGAADAAAMQSGQSETLLPDWPGNRQLARLFGGPAYPVTRHLREGDRLGAFVVLETPGHTPGHLSFWRPADRVLILGDVLAHQHPLSGRVDLIEPLARFTCDPQRNRVTLQRIAELEPRLLCFGHGPPLRDPQRLRQFAAAHR